MGTLFGSDRVLLYDVEPWNTLGFGAPAFGDNYSTINMPIAGLVDEIGRIQLYVMTHIDALRTQPPSLNTVKRLGKMVNRVHQVLAGRMKEYNEVRLEPGHATPAPEIFVIHPVPYFNSPIVRNRWLKEYNRLCMIALTNMMQHSDNNLALTVTSKFATDVWQYFNEIKLLVGSELLNVPAADLKEDDFQFAEEHYLAYDPEQVTINVEALDTPGPIMSLPTEDDLRPLFNGIPANLIAPVLKQYPVTTAHDFSGTVVEPGEGAPAASGPKTATATPTLGGPQI